VWLVYPAVLMGLGAACTGRPRDDGDAATAPADTTLAFALERGPCFGECPTYSLSIARGGQVRIVGLGALESRAPWLAEVPADSVAALLAEFERSGWFDLPDRFVPGEPGCARAASDHPSVTATAVAGGRQKTVEHYLGCFDAPALLGVLEARIDSLAGTGRWLSSP
jgi:hypothetical protein